MAKAVVIRKTLSTYKELPNCIEVFKLPETLKPHEVEIDIRAIAMNFADYLSVTGAYQVPLPLPATPGMDFSGQIQRVGSAVTNVSIGQRVYGGNISARDLAAGRASAVGGGGWSQVAVMPARYVKPFPDNISYVQASMLSTTYGTAHYALKYEGRVQPGEVVLVHAAAGALGLAAVQVAKALCAVVIGTASSEAKLAVARSSGADYTVNYVEQDFVSVVKDILKKEGRSKVDVVFDPVGLPVQSSKLMGFHSRLLVLGFTAWNNASTTAHPPGETPGKLPTLAVNRLLVKHASVIGIYLFSCADEMPELMATVQREVYEALEAGIYNPVVYPKVLEGLESISDGLDMTLNRGCHGKVCVALKPMTAVPPSRRSKL